jgi:radical SAM superfamily enzyme YgiQ (UPF0313 family)
VQFSRGCPFQCEFCDIIVLYGRKPRTKTPEQLLKELDCLYDLGWRRGVFMVDDNFIGNKRNVKLLLNALKDWQKEHQYPFRFNTEASVDLAADPELMDLMVDCNFDAVFLGIETPDEESLSLTKKFQNTRSSLAESVEQIIRAGLRPMAGFIIGFDGEKSGAASRVIDFVEEAAIPTAMLGMLQALPNTGLWHRLEKEGRLLATEGISQHATNQTMLMNFQPTRPVEEIAAEYIQAFRTLYEPDRYLERTYRCFLKLGAPRSQTPFKLPEWVDLRALAIVIWRQGIKRSTRIQFWRRLFGILRHNPAVWDHYITVCAHNEHFLEYRETVGKEIAGQLAAFKAKEAESRPVETLSKV